MPGPSNCGVGPFYSESQKKRMKLDKQQTVNTTRATKHFIRGGYSPACIHIVMGSNLGPYIDYPH